MHEVGRGQLLARVAGVDVDERIAVADQPVGAALPDPAFAVSPVFPRSAASDAFAAETETPAGVASLSSSLYKSPIFIRSVNAPLAPK